MTKEQQIALEQLSTEREGLIRQKKELERKIQNNTRKMKNVEQASFMSVHDFMDVVPNIASLLLNRNYRAVDVNVLFPPEQNHFISNPWHVIALTPFEYETRSVKMIRSQIWSHQKDSKVIYESIQKSQTPFYSVVAIYSGLCNPSVNTELATKEQCKGVYLPHSRFQFLEYLGRFVSICNIHDTFHLETFARDFIDFYEKQQRNEKRTKKKDFFTA